MTDNELLALYQALETHVLEAGAFIRDEFANFSFSDVKFKGQNDLVSYVDIQAEKMLKANCLELIPGSGFINEESGTTEGSNDYTWVIDPLDGTTNFTHGIPHFSVSIALMEKGTPILGYVYGIMLNEMFGAMRGKGAFLNGKSIRVSPHTSLKSSVIVTGFPYERKDWVSKQLEILDLLVSRSHGFRRLGSAALDLAYVACGRMEGFFEFGLNPWDLAAGALIIQEAGGHVSDFQGGADYMFGKQILGTNGHVHGELLSVIQERIP